MFYKKYQKLTKQFVQKYFSKKLVKQNFQKYFLQKGLQK